MVPKVPFSFIVKAIVVQVLVPATQLEQLWDWCLTLFPQEKLKKIELKTKMQQELKANQFDKKVLIKWIDKRGPKWCSFP